MDEVEVAIPPFFYELKKTPLFKNAVIAGGFLRDQCLRINPSDVDIFVPSQGLNAFLDKMLNNKGEVYSAGGPVFSKVNYEAVGTSYMGKGLYNEFIKFDATSNDGRDVDIMAMHMKVEDFGNLLIESFPFGNQQVFHDGKKLFFTNPFEFDISTHTMTLTNVRNLEEFPNLIDKYNKMKDRYRKEIGMRLRFGSDYILTKRKGDDWL